MLKFKYSYTFTIKIYRWIVCVRIILCAARKYGCETYATENLIASSTLPCRIVGAVATKCARLFTTSELLRVLFARLHRTQTFAHDKAALSFS